jgi:serine/threonine-protein kinase HipA
MANVQYLDVYLQGQYVGELSSADAMLAFSYDAEYMAGGDVRTLSNSLPLQAEPFSHSVAEAFFSGLLPDESVRTRLAKVLGVSEKNSFSLLREIGGECAGAVSLYPKGVEPTGSGRSYNILDDDRADEILVRLDRHPMLADVDNVRISGAGAQNKLVIAFVDGKIAIPTHNTPSTHIIKPAIRDFDHSVANEFFCMKLAKAVGLPVPDVEIFWLKDKSYYLIERYDRLSSANGMVERLHQEDFCQAKHIVPEMKYESDGGPALSDCFDLLDDRITSGAMAGKNKITLLRGVIFNFLIGNGDAHGKNFSLLYEGGAEELAPFYDMMCTVTYFGSHKSKMAMKVGGKYKFVEVHGRHFDKLAEQIGFRPDFVQKNISSLVKVVGRESELLRDELNQNPKTASPIYRDIVAIITKNCEQVM